MGLVLVISQGLHAFVDFAMIVPAVFLPASLLMGMVYGAVRRKQIELRRRKEAVPTRKLHGPPLSGCRESKERVSRT